MAKEVIIGIDLGTTNTVVDFMEVVEPQIIPNVYLTRTTPSVLRFL